MNEILYSLYDRRSVRAFEDRPVAEEQKRMVLDAAAQAPSAGCQQLYTILDITDPALKERLAETCDHQSFIARAPVVLIFCADCLKWFDAYVEAGCQQAQADLSAALPQLYLTDRFSPGYGDLPLSLQPALCEILDVQRRLGLYVTDSLLLNPMKSVTAILGLAPTPRPTPIRGCAVCPNRGECAYRKGGSTCV